MASSEVGTAEDVVAKGDAPLVGATKDSKSARGYAPIKAEFLAANHKRQLAAEFLPTTVTQQLSDKITQSQTENADRKSENTTVKLKGRNRNNERPVYKAAQSGVCIFTARGFEDEPCPFGDTCRCSHDIASYMSKREPDIGDKCYAFETFGRCRFGALCRYGKSHVKEDGTNIIDEEKWAKHRGQPSAFNEMTKDLQHCLRKRTLSFPKTKLFHSHGNKVQRVDNPEKGADTVATDAVEGETTRSIEVPISKSTDTELKEPGRLGMDCDASAAARRIKVNDMLRRPYLSPLTTVGNLPFRRICTEFGAGITCGEMAMAGNILQGHAGEWALLRRHSSERCFGVQICGGNADMMARCAELISERLNVDFIDINAACPLDLVCRKGEGAGMMGRPSRLLNAVKAIRAVTKLPVSVKLRTGIDDHNDHRTAHELVPLLADAGADFVAIHGRTRDQRYTRQADWDYLNRCAGAGIEKSFPVLGVGDILSYEDYYNRLDNTDVSGVVVARGALIKPWIFTEITERRHWDISSSERFDMLRRFANYGLEHWGSDTRGVETTRRFLLEWQSLLCRYIPVGLLEVLPQKINERPPAYYGRDDLETLMASPNCADWIKLGQMLLGPVPDNFSFLPKHKANAYQ